MTGQLKEGRTKVKLDEETREKEPSSDTHAVYVRREERENEASSLLASSSHSQSSIESIGRSMEERGSR